MSIKAIIARVQHFVDQVNQRWQATRIGRTLARYGSQNGSLLCGGLAYTALFSLFAMLTIGYSLATYVIGNNSEMRDALTESINTLIPGLIATPGHTGVLEVDQLVMTSFVSWTSLLAAGVLLWSAMSFIGALRSAVRAMFDLGESPRNAILDKVQDLIAFFAIIFAITVSAGASFFATRFNATLRDWLNLGTESAGSYALTSAAGFLLALVIDAGLVAYVIRVLAGIRVPWRRLLGGSLIAGLVFSAIRIGGVQLIGAAADRNALLASFAVLVTLLLAVNFASRVLLYASAWVATAQEELTAE